MINGQNYAIRLEHILCKIFKCERFGFGGIVNSDFIRRQPFAAMTAGLACIYANSDINKQREIEEFEEKIIFYFRFSIDDLLAFKNASKEIDGTLYQIEYKDGKEAIETLIGEFDEVCK